jgi:hypothetical protein
MMDKEMPQVQKAPDPTPPEYDSNRAERIRELYEAMHAATSEEEKARIWNELGEYILGPSTPSA